MADFVAHSLFAEDVGGKMNPWAQKIASYYSRAFHWGAQGPDILMNHHYISGGDALSECGYTMHSEHTEDIIRKMRQTACDARGTALGRCMQAYLYGFLCHYALDSTIHHYVAAMIEKKLEEGPEDDDVCLHVQIENDIDTSLYRYRTGESVNSFPVAEKFDFGFDRERKRLVTAAVSGLYLPVLAEYFGCDTTAKDIAECLDSTLKNVYLQYKFTGAARAAAGILMKTEKSRKRTLSHIKYRIPDWDALNLSHEPWKDLQGNERTSSVPELFAAAGKKAVRLVDRTGQMLKNGKIEEEDLRFDFGGILIPKR